MMQQSLKQAFQHTTKTWLALSLEILVTAACFVLLNLLGLSKDMSIFFTFVISVISVVIGVKVTTYRFSLKTQIDVHTHELDSSKAPGQAIFQAQPMMQTNVNIGAQQANKRWVVRALYFVLIGWWLSFLCLQVGFLLCFFIITFPLGLTILNRIPQIMTLKLSTKLSTKRTFFYHPFAYAAYAPNMMDVNMLLDIKWQYPILMRVIYYLFIGWWVGYLWAILGYFFCLTILGMPLGMRILNQFPLVLTLRRN